MLLFISLCRALRLYFFIVVDGNGGLLNWASVIVYPDTPPITASYDIIIDCIRPDHLTKSNSPASSTKQQILSLSAFPSLPDNFVHLKSGVNSRYVCLNPPLLHFMDSWGPLIGLGAAAGHVVSSQLLAWASAVSRGSSRWPPGQLRWAFFKADGQRLRQLLLWVASGSLEVPVDASVSFSEVPRAFARMQARGVRGKVVVTF